MPIFSVIVPIYNVQEYLKKCIDSIIGQTFSDFELILVNDGSPDNCLTICNEYAEKDNRIRVINKENGGLVSSRNAGLRAACGEYICYVDGDDWIDKNMLEKAFTKAINPSRPDIIIFNASKVFEDSICGIKSYLKEGYYSRGQMEKEIIPFYICDRRKRFFTQLIFLVAWNKIYNRELLEKHYCREERIRMNEDAAFTFETVYYANSIYFMTDYLYFYNRQNVSSITSTYDKNRFFNNSLLTNYLSKNLIGINREIDRQLNSFFAYIFISAIFDEVRSKQKISLIVKHIKGEIKKYSVFSNIHVFKLPFLAVLFIFLFKLKLYRIGLIWTKILIKVGYS